MAPSVEAIKPGDGTWLAADEKLDDGPSALFDAVLVLPAAEGATMLSRHPAACAFVAVASCASGRGSSRRPRAE